MKSVLIRNIALSLIITITSSVLSLLINRYFILNLGIENLGLLRLFTQSIFFIAILDMGLSTAATVAFYKPLMNADKSKISSLYHTVKKFYEKISLIVFFLGLGFMPFLGWLIEDISSVLPYIYWMLFVLILSLNYHLMRFSILFLADQKYGFVTIVSGVSLIFEKALQLLVVLYFPSFLVFIIIGFLGFAFKYVFYKHHYDKKYFKMEDIGVYDKSIRQGATRMVFHKLSNMVIYNTDYIVIVKFIGLSAVGIYSSYLMLVSLVMTLVSILHNVLDPLVGKLVARESNEFNLELWFVFFRVSFFIASTVGLIFYAAATPFVVLWLGPEFVFLGLTLALISANLFFDIIKWPMEVFKYKYAFYNDIHLPVFEVFINLTISIILVQYIGVNGVVIGTIASNIIVVVFLKTFLVFNRCFNVGVGVYLFELLKNVISMIFSVLLFLSLCELISPEVAWDKADWLVLSVFFMQMVLLVLFSTSMAFLVRRAFRKAVLKFIEVLLKRS